MENLKKKLRAAISHGIPNPNDEWSNGKYDTSYSMEYLVPLVEQELEKAFKAGRAKVATRNGIVPDYKDFAEYKSKL